MRERDVRDALSGDGGAAARVVLEAVRRGEWSLVREVGSAMSGGGDWSSDLTCAQLLSRGVRDFEGDVEIEGGMSLPSGLRVAGNLSGWGVPVTESVWVGDGTAVGGRLDLRNCEVKIGKDVSAGSLMLLGGWGVIGSGLRVGWLDLDNTSEIHVPGDAVVGGGVRASHSLEVSFGEGIQVGGGMRLTYSEGVKLPRGLHVPGNLDLDGATDVVLPEGLRVGGDMYLRPEGRAVVPEDLEVGGVLYVHDGVEVPESVSARLRVVSEWFLGSR